MRFFNLFLSRILRVVLIFLLIFIWVRYYNNSLWQSVVITAVLTFIIECLFTTILKRKDIKASLKKKEILQAEGYCNSFIFNGKSLDFYYELLSKSFTTTKKTDYVIFEKEESKNILFPMYSYNKFSVNDLIFIYNKTKKSTAEKIIVCTNEIDDNVKNLAKKLPISFILLDKFETFEGLMKKYDCYPNELISIDSPKLSFKSLLAYSLNKKKTKGYIFASFVLLISSLFVKVNIYYLIISSLLLLLAIFSFTNPFYNKKCITNIL